MAQHHPDLLAAGARVVGISVDDPRRNAAMVEKLHLPFPLLSDPDGEGAIKPFGVWHEGADMARPAVVVLAPDGSEVLRQVGEDFADRLPEEDLLARVQALGMPGTTQDAPTSGTAEPGEHAVPLEFLGPYFLGNRFAAISLGERVPEAEEPATRLREQADRFRAAVATLTG